MTTEPKLARRWSTVILKAFLVAAVTEVVFIDKHRQTQLPGHGHGVIGGGIIDQYQLIKTTLWNRRHGFA